MRSNRALWLWLGGLLLALAAFLALVALAYFEKVASYSLFLNGWMIAALVFFLAAFACFFAAVEGLPVPVRPLTRPDFPRIKIEIFGTGSMDTEREAGTGLVVPVRLRTFHARFSHAGTGQPASLTVLLYLQLVPGSWGRAAEAVCPPLDWTLPPALNLSPLSMPFALAPGAAVDGDLVYEVPAYYLDKMAEPGNARLELWDQASGKRMSIRAGVGSYERDDMTESSGAVEELGPEHAVPPAVAPSPDPGPGPGPSPDGPGPAKTGPARPGSAPPAGPA